jgi:hypothetical protein
LPFFTACPLPSSRNQRGNHAFQKALLPLFHSDAESYVYSVLSCCWLQTGTHGTLCACRSSADPSPLARAEHIVYLSAFFNVEHRAIKYFENIKKSYQRKAIPSEGPAPNAPKVAWLSVYPDATTSFLFNAAGEALGPGLAAVVSFARYKTLLTLDAGGDLPSQAVVANITGAFASLDDIVFAQSEIGTLPKTLAALQSALQDVDILIDESYQFDPAAASVVRLMRCWRNHDPVSQAMYSTAPWKILA